MEQARKRQNDLREFLAGYGQEHLLHFVEKGMVPEKDMLGLFTQLETLDVPEVMELFKEVMKPLAPDDGQLEPPADVVTLDGATPELLAQYEKTGMDAIAKGEVAAIVLGGGAGTRLGLDGPKGLYSLPGLPSGKSLYQLFAERILRLKQSAGGRLPFLVMTSPANHQVTVDFFEKNNFFGLPREDCMFFPQGTLPSITFDGKIMLEAPATVTASPDGNGGIYPSLHKAGLLEGLRKSGVKYIHIFGVDNILARPADPRFVGCCVAKQVAAGNKSVWKCAPDEKVGVMATKGGKSCVVEYTELSEKMLTATDEAGKLSFGAGNICNHFFTTEFLADVVIPNFSKHYHKAEKKIAFADPETGATTKPECNNGIKMEAFIFDVFPMAGPSVAILECLRETEFAPIKNASGGDSPDTALGLIRAMHRAWIEAAGGKVEGENTFVELSPLVSYGGEGLSELCNGKTFSSSCEIKPRP